MGLLLPVATAIVMDKSPTTAGFSASVIGTSQFALGTLGSATNAIFYNERGTTLVLSMAAVAALVAVFFALSIKEEIGIWE
jgi:hypothetical protein